MTIQHTIASRWKNIRTVTEVDDALVYASASNTSKYQSVVDAIDAGTIQAYVRPLRGNEVEFRFRMAAEGDTASYEIHALREKDDAVFVCSGTMTGGSASASDLVDGTAGVYADTVTVASEEWPTTIKAVDASGSNRQSRLILDALGYRMFVVLITALSTDAKVAIDATEL